MHYVPRVLAQTMRRQVTFPAVLVTGAQQTGKTILLRTEFGDAYRYPFVVGIRRYVLASTSGGS
jgi:hypothetical protein